MIGFPFDSQVTYEADGTPVFDRAVSSAPLRQLIKSMLSNGVLPNPSTNLQVQPGTGMNVIVNPGFAVIEGGLKYEENQRTLAVQASDTTYDRIDSVVLRWNDNTNARICDFYVLEGTPASSPVRPTLNRESAVYEIGLADLFIPANSSAISVARITDTRYEAERCGIISSITEFDSDTIYKQIQADLAEFKEEEQADFTAWFEYIKEQLSEDAAGHLQAQIGAMSELETDEKTELVKAINEVNEKAKNGGKNLVGDEFDEAKTYAVGDYCIYENVLYVFISAKTAGAWDSTLVEATTVADELSEQNKNLSTIQWWIDNNYLPNPNTLMYIYDEGVIPDYIGGLDTYNGGSGSVSLNAKYVQFSCSVANVYQFVGTKKIINLTPYKKICAEVEILSAVNDTYDQMHIRIGNNHLTEGEPVRNVSIMTKGSIVKLEMDISDITGSYYIAILSLYCSSSRVHSIWLE